MSEQPTKPHLARWLVKPPSVARWLMVLMCACILSSNAAPLRIMPLGDSITAGYTDNPNWNVPFEFGYRSRLYTLLTNAGYDFVFVGGSLEPFNNIYGDPTKGGTVSPTLDLRPLGQNGHRGYGGVNITTTNSNVASYLTADTPDVILLLIGINGISTSSPANLSTLVTNIFSTRPDVRIIVAQITPYNPSTSANIAKNVDLVNYNTYIRDTLVPYWLGQGKRISTVNQYRNLLTDPNNAASAIDASKYSNGINHPTNAVYALMAATWLDGILTVTPPTLPVLDQNTFSSSIPAGTKIGKFAQPPAPSNETLSFSLIAGTGSTDNSKFSIVGNELRTSSYSFSSAPNGSTYSILVRATGSPSGQTGDRIFTLSLNGDSDADQLPDSWEMAKAGNLTSLTVSGDFDHDGLTDAQEYSLSIGSYPSIDPTKYDTDADGLSDGEEINGSAPRPPTNPTKTDTDNDNICDACENNTGVYVSLLKTGTNPTIADTDGDNRSDGAELMEGSNPLSAASPTAPTSSTVSNTAGTYSSSVSNSDLLQGLTGSNVVYSGWYTGNNASPTRLNDGLHGGYATSPAVEGAWSNASGSVITYTLPAGNGIGWDLSSITTIADWSPSGGFGNQHYQVSIQRVGETAFSLLASPDFEPFSSTTAGGSKVTITPSSGKLARGVIAIRFTMLATNGANNRSVYREFDVQGTATTAPASTIAGIMDSRASRSEFSVTWFSYPGKTYRVENSVNLQDWTVLSSAYPSGGLTTNFIESPVPLSRTKSFYRITTIP